MNKNANGRFFDDEIKDVTMPSASANNFSHYLCFEDKAILKGKAINYNKHK